MCSNESTLELLDIKDPIKDRFTYKQLGYLSVLNKPYNHAFAHAALKTYKRHLRRKWLKTSVFKRLPHIVQVAKSHINKDNWCDIVIHDLLICCGFPSFLNYYDSPSETKEYMNNCYTQQTPSLRGRIYVPHPTDMWTLTDWALYHTYHAIRKQHESKKHMNPLDIYEYYYIMGLDELESMGY